MPVRSMSSKGPMRKPPQSRATASIWAGVATPSWRILRPSVVKARPPRLTRKPGLSLTRTGVRVMRAPSAVKAARVASSVSGPSTISTSFISGTGLKKCIPATRWRCSQTRAMEAIGKDEVLLAIGHSGRTTASMSRNRLCLTSRSSKTASITASQSATSERAAPIVRRSFMAPAAAASRRPFSTRRSSRPKTASAPAAAPPSRLSSSTAARPPIRATWTMPWPMAPAPITATRQSGPARSFMSARPARSGWRCPGRCRCTSRRARNGRRSPAAPGSRSARAAPRWPRADGRGRWRRRCG